MALAILQQITGDTLKVREGSPRGFLKGGNYVHAEFQSMDASGKMYFQAAVFTELPVLNDQGNITASSGETEWFGVAVDLQDIPAVALDTKLSLLGNAQKKALPAVSAYLLGLNPGIEFTTITL